MKENTDQSKEQVIKSWRTSSKIMLKQQTFQTTEFRTKDNQTDKQTDIKIPTSIQTYLHIKKSIVTLLAKQLHFVTH